MINKEFDSVKFMRDIRQKLHKEYEKNPELRENRLKAIRKRYKIKQQNEAHNSH